MMRPTVLAVVLLLALAAPAAAREAKVRSSTAPSWP
jgi:hypothetical protein